MEYKILLAVFILSVFAQPQRKIFSWINGNKERNFPVYPSQKNAGYSNASQIGARSHHCMVKLSSTEFLVVGGYGFNEIGKLTYLNDIWSFDITLNQWNFRTGSKMGGSGIKNFEYDEDNTMSGRGYHYCHRLDNGIVYIFGGYYGVIISDFIAFNPVINQVKNIQHNLGIEENLSNYANKGNFYNETRLGCRYAYGSTKISPTQIVYYGGYGCGDVASSCYLNDMFVYDSSLNLWKWMRGDGSHPTAHFANFGTKGLYSSTNEPGSRYFPKMWHISPSSVYLYGGGTYSSGCIVSSTNWGYMRDLWEIDLITSDARWISGGQDCNTDGSFTNFSDYNTLNHPSSAYNPSVGTLYGDDVLFVFGGYYSSKFFNTMSYYRISTNEWKYVSGEYDVWNTIGNYKSGLKSISGRRGSSAVVLVHDIYVFGGRLITKALAKHPNYVETVGNDLWKFDSLNFEWENVNGWGDDKDVNHVEKEKEFHELNVISERSSAFTWKPLKSKSFYVFGGIGRGTSVAENERVMDDLWEFSIDQNMWKHLRGSLGTGGTGVLVEIGIYNETNDPSSRKEGASLVISDDELVMHGGYGYLNYAMEDLWFYSIQKNQWKCMSGYGKLGYRPNADVWNEFRNTTTTGGRYGHSIAPSINGSYQFFIYGGHGYSLESTAAGRLGDVLLYDYSLNEWSYLWNNGNEVNQKGVYSIKGNFSALNAPGSRYHHVMWKVVASISLRSWLMFGGNALDRNGVASPISDLWEYSHVLNQWNFLGGSTLYGSSGYRGTPHTFNESTFPSARSKCLATFQSKNNLYLFGGSAYFGANIYSANDLFIYNYTLKQWKYEFGDITGNTKSVYGRLNEVTRQNVPGAREDIKDQGFIHENRFYIFGGYGFDGHTKDYLNDVWNYRFGHVCYGISEDEYTVCNSNGKCVGADVCVCDDLWEGYNCSDPLCYFGRNPNGRFSKQCSGRGKCVGPNECICDYGSIGNACDKLNWVGWLVIGASSSVSISILLTLTLIICICGFQGDMFQIASRVKQMSKLENIDVLLREQELERDVSIAHLKINPKIFEIKYKDLKIERKIGSGGSSSVVYEALWQNSIKVAFKCFKILSFLDQEKFSEFESEAEILGSVSHPHCVQFFGCCLENPRIGIIMEYCSNGDAKSYLSDENNEVMLSQKFKWILSICKGMVYLHSKKIVHRDLKPENVLIDDSLSVKIVDFGISKITQSTKMKTSRVGTAHYVAPEVTLGKFYDSKVDVFSWSITAYEILTENFSPFIEEGEKAAFDIQFRVANNPEYRPNTKALEDMKVDKFLIDVITVCWSDNPEMRLPFDEIQKIMEEKGQNELMKNNIARSSRYPSNAKSLLNQTHNGVDVKKLIDRIFELEQEVASLQIKNDKLKGKTKKEKKVPKSIFPFSFRKQKRPKKPKRQIPEVKKKEKKEKVEK